MNLEEQLRHSIDRHTAGGAPGDWGEVESMFVRAHRRRGIVRAALGSASVVVLAASLAVAANLSKPDEGFVNPSPVHSFRYSTTSIYHSTESDRDDTLEATGEADLDRGIRFERTSQWNWLETGDAIYLQDAADPGSPWGRAPRTLRDEVLFGGEDLFGLFDDPAGYLEALEAISADVQARGNRRIAGVDTAVYDVTVDIDKAVAAAPKSDRAFMRETLANREHRRLRVWVDDSGVTRRVRTSFAVSVEGVSYATGTIARTITIETLQATVEAEVPDGDQVQPVESLARVFFGQTCLVTTSSSLGVNGSQGEPQTQSTC